jgi:hypothetical protein
MHYRYFVLTNKSNAKTSAEARNYVENWLTDEGFCSQGRFGSGMADWFVIGGRWSGVLISGLLDKEKFKLFEEEFERQQLGWVNNKDRKEEEQRKKSDKLFMQYFPKFKGEVPYYRDTYTQSGSEDDAKIVTKKIWDALLKEYEGTDAYGGSENITDTDDDVITKKNTVGKKWVVVVDYHN